MSIRRVLAVGAHPDDVEIMCAGTLLLLGERGCEIHVVSLTPGDCGSATLPPEEIARVRLEEARRASAAIGARYQCLGFRDLSIYDDDASNRRVTACVREIDPGLVITHPPADYISDHETTSRLVRNACFNAPVRNYDTSGVTQAGAIAAIPAIPAIPSLIYAHPLEGIDIYGREVQPRLYVDISDVLERKLGMLAQHESQREWLRAHHGIDEYLESVRSWNATLGSRATLAMRAMRANGATPATCASRSAGRDVAYAEAFVPHHGHAYPRAPILWELLGDLVIGAEQDTA